MFPPEAVLTGSAVAGAYALQGYWDLLQNQIGSNVPSESGSQLVNYFSPLEVLQPVMTKVQNWNNGTVSLNSKTCVQMMELV